MILVLNHDETMLLLIAKDWQHKDVATTEDAPAGSIEYIQKCCDFRCGVSAPYKADVFTIYLGLATKLLSVHNFTNLLRELVKFNPFNPNVNITRDDVLNRLIAEFSGLRVNNLLLDESLIKK